MLTAQPHFQCNYPRWSQPEPPLQALYPSRDGCECRLGKGTLSSSSCKATMIYATMLQMKPSPATLNVTSPGHRRGHWSMWLGTGVNRKAPCWMVTLRKCEHSQRRRVSRAALIWKDNKWLCWDWGIRAPCDPEHLGVHSDDVQGPPSSLSFSEPLSLRQHFSSLLGYRTVFIFITQQECVSYKFELYQIHVSFHS